MDPDVKILAHRVDALEVGIRDALTEIRDSMREIAVNTSKLALLEERHAETREGLNRAFADIREVRDTKCSRSDCSVVAQALQSIETQAKSLEERIEAIERNMPALIEARKWLVSGVVGIVALVGATVIGLVMR